MPDGEPTHELSEFHKIQPPGLALELAKQERLEPAAKVFESKIHEQLKDSIFEYIEKNKAEIENWVFTPVAEDDPRYWFQRLYRHFLDAGEVDQLWQIKRELNQSEAVIPRFIYGPDGHPTEMAFDLGQPSNITPIQPDKFQPPLSQIYQAEGSQIPNEDFGSKDLPQAVIGGREVFDKYQAAGKIEYWSGSGFDFNSFLNNLAKQDPEGFNAYMEIVTTNEEVSLSGNIAYYTKLCEQINRRRFELINRGEPAGQVLAELNSVEKVLQLFQSQHKGLEKFRNSGFTLPDKNPAENSPHPTP